MKYAKNKILWIPILLAGCPFSSGDDEPCKPENNCIILANGDVDCAPGYVWQDITDPNNFVCVEDECMTFGRYGDGVCDECVNPDPDCAASASDTQQATHDSSSTDEENSHDDTAAQTQTEESQQTNDESAQESQNDDVTTTTTPDETEISVEESAQESGNDDVTVTTTSAETENSAEETATTEDETATTGDETDEENSSSAASVDPSAPIILSLLTNISSMTPDDDLGDHVGPELIVSAVVTDPDGIDDLIGGVLVDPETGGSYGAFDTSAAEGAYELTLDWEDIHAVYPINATEEGVERAFVARFFDQTGHTVEDEVSVALTCYSSSEVICDGECVWLSGDEDNCGECGESIDHQGFSDTEGIVCDDGEFVCAEDTHAMCGDACEVVASFEEGCGDCESTIICQDVLENVSDIYFYDYHWGAEAGGCQSGECVYRPYYYSYSSAAELQDASDDWQQFSTCDDVCAGAGSSVVCDDNLSNDHCDGAAGCSVYTTTEEHPWTYLTCDQPFDDVPDDAYELFITCACRIDF